MQNILSTLAILVIVVLLFIGIFQGTAKTQLDTHRNTFETNMGQIDTDSTGY